MEKDANVYRINGKLVNQEEYDNIQLEKSLANAVRQIRCYIEALFSSMS